MRRKTTITMTALAGCLYAVLAGASAVAAKETLTLEVAEIGSRYVPDLPVGQTQPLRGTTFVTEGYLYAEGTLTCAEGACDGVVYDEQGNPAPEFPDQVVGMWTCYGTFTEVAQPASTGPLLVSTQYYDLGDGPGADMFVTSGWELADVGVPVSRAITGGTGKHAGASGVQTQALLGYNNAETVLGDVPAFGVALSVELVTD
jgi:hypothetical protein